MAPIVAVTLVLSLLYIFGRGGLLLTPEDTVAFYRRTINDPRRLRLRGDLLVFMAIPVIVVARMSRPDHGSFTFVIEALGWMFAAVAVWLHAEPERYQRQVDRFLGASPAVHRSVGALGIAGGLFLAWGAFVLL